MKEFTSVTEYLKMREELLAKSAQFTSDSLAKTVVHSPEKTATPNAFLKKLYPTDGTRFNDTDWKDDDGDDNRYPDENGIDVSSGEYFEDVSKVQLSEEGLQDYLNSHDLDEESLKQLSPLDQVKTVIALWNEWPRDRGFYNKNEIWLDKENPRTTPEIDRTRQLHWYATRIIRNLLTEGAVTFEQIFTIIDVTKSDACQQIVELESLVQLERDKHYPHGLFVQNSEGHLIQEHCPVLPLEKEFVTSLNKLHVKSAKVAETNYFFTALLPQLEKNWQNDQEKSIDYEYFGFYEIEEGNLVVVNDRDIKFYADRDAAQSLITKMRDLNEARLNNPEEYYNGSDTNHPRADEEEFIDDAFYDTSEWRGRNMLFMDEFFDIPPEDIAGYVQMLQRETRKTIEEDFGIGLNKLTIREQIHLLDYLKGVTVGNADVMKLFVSTYGINALRSFLSLAKTQEVTGDHIVAFGISVPEEIAEKVFAGYADLLDQVADIDAFLVGEFEGDENTKTHIGEIAKNKLQKQAADFLVAQINRQDAISATESNDLLIEVEKAAGLAAAIAEALRSRKITSVDSFQSFRQDILPGTAVHDSPLFAEMLAIYEKNYTEKYDYSPEGRQALLASFNENLQKETAKVYVWRIGETDVLTFLYADEYESDQKVYIGGLNSNPAFKESRAGKGLIEQMLRDYDAKGYVITAEAAPDNAMAYMSIYDFVGVKRSNDPDEPFVFDVARQKDWNFVSKNVKKGEILSKLADTDVYKSSDAAILYIKADGSVSVLDPYLAQGYVVTKMLAEKDVATTGLRYFILEYAPQVQTELSPTNSQIKSAA